MVVFPWSTWAMIAMLRTSVARMRRLQKVVEGGGIG
jgi:hypothetical protein